MKTSPKHLLQDIEESPVVNRLTDISRYPGSHKHRFDENGRGVGLNGRRSPRDVLAMLRESTKTFDPLGIEMDKHVLLL